MNPSAPEVSLTDDAYLAGYCLMMGQRWLGVGRATDGRIQFLFPTSHLEACERDFQANKWVPVGDYRRAVQEAFLEIKREKEERP